MSNGDAPGWLRCIIASIYCLIGLALCAWSPALVIIGAMNLDRCPAQDMLPVWMVVEGCIPFLPVAFVIVQRLICAQEGGTLQAVWYAIIGLAALLFPLVWFLYGTSLVFGCDGCDDDFGHSANNATAQAGESTGVVQVTTTLFSTVASVAGTQAAAAMAAATGGRWARDSVPNTATNASSASFAFDQFGPATRPSAATTKPSAIVGITQWAHQATNLADKPATPTPSAIADAADVTHVTSLADKPATLKPSAIPDVTQATNLADEPASTGTANAPTASNKATVVEPASTAATNTSQSLPTKLAINALCDPRNDQCDTKMDLVCDAANQRCHYTGNPASGVRSSTRESGCDALTFDFAEFTVVVVWVVTAALGIVIILAACKDVSILAALGCGCIAGMLPCQKNGTDDDSLTEADIREYQRMLYYMQSEI